MDELVKEVFGEIPRVREEEMLTLAMAWLDQVEREKQTLSDQYEKLRLKNIELTLSLGQRQASMLDADAHVVRDDHLSFKRTKTASHPNEASSAFPPASKEDLLFALGWLKESRDECSTLTVENRRLLKENYALIARLDSGAEFENDDDVVNGDHLSLRTPYVPPTKITQPNGDIAVQWRLGGRLQTIPLPPDLKQIEEWTGRYLNQRVMLFPRAIAAAKKGIFEDVGLVYQALLMLGTWRDLLVQGGLSVREDYKRKLTELGLRHAPSIGSAASASVRQSYLVSWNGANYELTQALKRGVSWDQRRTLRVYFCFDAPDRIVRVGHLPSHLPNRFG